jgi:hypothetical protein
MVTNLDRERHLPDENASSLCSRDRLYGELLYTHCVRRLLSAFLVLLFSLPLIAPALALTGDPQNQLPICCRKNGAHRCSELMDQQAVLEQSKPRISAPCPHCPAYPDVVTSVRHADLAAPTSAAIFARLVSHPALHAQTEAHARVALDLSRQKRGPPTHSL